MVVWVRRRRRHPHLRVELVARIIIMRSLCFGRCGHRVLLLLLFITVLVVLVVLVVMTMMGVRMIRERAIVLMMLMVWIMRGEVRMRMGVGVGRGGGVSRRGRHRAHFGVALLLLRVGRVGGREDFCAVAFFVCD